MNEKREFTISESENQHGTFIVVRENGNWIECFAYDDNLEAYTKKEQAIEKARMLITKMKRLRSIPQETIIETL